MSSKTVRSVSVFGVVALGIASLAACNVAAEVDEPNVRLETSSAGLARSASLSSSDASTAALRKIPSDTIVANPSEGTVCDVCAILGCACANSECYECGFHVTASTPSRP